MTTLLLITVLQVLTPSAELGERLASVEARRAAIDERRPTGQAMRATAAIAYAMGAAGMVVAAYDRHLIQSTSDASIRAHTSTATTAKPLRSAASGNFCARGTPAAAPSSAPVPMMASSSGSSAPSIA